MNPKKKSTELKRISRENLNGRYRLSMSVFLTVTLINLFSDLPFTYLLGNVDVYKRQQLQNHSPSFKFGTAFRSSPDLLPAIKS